MDYYLLTDLAARLGYELAVSGAETFRVEDSVRRLLLAYGIECEVFAIPNCLVISLETANGKPLSIMKRIGFHGNNLEAVGRLNALCRKICAERPEPGTAEQWLRQTKAECRVFSTPMYYLGNFLGPAGFSLLFGGTLRDAFLAGLMGLIVGLVNRYMSKLETNPFFSTIAAAFAMAVPAYLLAGWGIADNIDAVIIGAAMILVPGLLITNSMRDLIYGDTNSGINRIVQVFLTAFAIALGTAAAWHVTAGVYGQTVSAVSVSYPVWAQCLAVLVGSVGFSILFNIHGWGSWLCIIASVMTWTVYLLAQRFGCDIYGMCLFATIFAATYAEIMAHPEISRDLVSDRGDLHAHARLRHLLHDAPRRGGQYAGGACQGSGDRRDRGQHRGRHSPGLDRLAAAAGLARPEKGACPRREMSGVKARRVNCGFR